jgi:hypothetical protein
LVRPSLPIHSRALEARASVLAATGERRSVEEQKRAGEFDFVKVVAAKPLKTLDRRQTATAAGASAAGYSDMAATR